MILCAALRIHVEGNEFDTILPCRRHGDGFSILKDLGIKPHQSYKVIEQGFICTDGTFLDRHDALMHAIQCGQLSESTKWYKKDHNDIELYSEDLY